MQSVRQADRRDLTALVRLAKELHQASDWAWVPFSPSALRRSLTQMMGKPDFCILMAEKDGEPCGLLFGMVDRVLYGNTLYASDIEFAAKSGGDELLDAFRDWARQAGAKALVMGVSNSGREAAKDRFFSKHGLVRSGGVYQERFA